MMRRTPPCFVAAALLSCEDGNDRPAVLEPCYAEQAAASPMCDLEHPPARLGAPTLGTGFFEDAFEGAGLAGLYGRRVTFGDVNGDDYPDFVAIETGVTRGLQHLMINERRTDGGRRFRDATADSGFTENRDGSDGQTALMVAFADVDNDGDLDLFSGSYSQQPTGERFVADPNELYLNDGSGGFSLLPHSGVHEPWPLTTAAAVFLDFDLDGHLDLFVGNFMIAYPDLESYQDNLYRGGGDGTFSLVNEASGILTGAPVGSAAGMYSKPTYGATSCDYDSDGWPDILTATYGLGWNDLWHNNRDGTFSNVAQAIGFAMDDQDNPSEPPWRDGGNTFAHACGDYDNDGDLDVMTAETAHGDFPRSTADRSRILRNAGETGGFAFERPPLSETGIEREVNGTGDNGEQGNEGDHGVSWLDFDNDGLLDLVIEQSAYPGNHGWLYHQRPDHTFEDVTGASSMRGAMVNSNGLSVDDYDRDGDLDILMGSVNTGSQMAPGGVEQVHLYENRVGDRSHFLYVTLAGTTANRQGIGARVTVTAGCLTQTREISGGKGTFGAADPAYAHFGLGDATVIERIEVRWPAPDHPVDIFENVAVDQFLEITQGQDVLDCRDPD